ncbi:unnamed protein product, partial [Musa hybrid cultivar]
GSGRGLDRCRSGVRSETYGFIDCRMGNRDSTTVPPPFPFQDRKKTSLFSPREMASVPAAQSHPLLLLLLLVIALLTHFPCSTDAASGPTASMRPASAALPGLKSVLIDEAKRRRRLSSFQICALCTCCGGPRGLCLPSPCCYTINCNIPNRPFGFCSFTPKTCNCFGCHL